MRSARARGAACVLAGLGIWLLGPPPGLEHSLLAQGLVKTGGPSAVELAQGAWGLLAVFAGVIAALLLRPLEMGPAVLLGLVASSVLHLATPAEAMQGYGESVTWLVVAAFLIAGAVQRTGLGERIALKLVALLGRTTLGLGYALVAADLILATVVPSNTARGGGILAPIFRSLAGALGSEPDSAPRRAGSYLAFVGAMATVTTSAMFLTGMAANGLIKTLAKDHMHVDFGWGTWALAMVIPGLLALALLPLLVRALYPPELHETGAARERAQKALAALGAWRLEEKIMAAVFLGLVALWATAPLHGMKTVTVAWIGVLVLILSGADRYTSMLSDLRTWDALIWLGGLLSLANLLKVRGLIGWMAVTVKAQVVGLEPLTAAIALACVYFFAMYGFSMLTAHISAMAGAFLAALAALGAPPMVSVALMAAFSNLCACLTVYSTGPVIVYYGFGYVPAGRWFGLGAVMSLFYLGIWLTAGLFWWKLLGWW